MAEAFARALRDHSLELQDLQGEHADEFLRLLRQLKDDLRGRLDSLGDPSKALDAFRIQAVLGETESGIRTLELKAKGQYDRASVEAADLAMKHIGDELDSLSKAFDAKPLDISLDAMKSLADPAHKLLANHFESSVQRYGLDLLNGVRQRLFIGMRTGDQYGEIVREVASEKGPLGQVGKANAERLVRTEVSSSYGSAQHSGLIQAARKVPSLKKVWLHVGSVICPVCIPLHGTERPLNGTWTIRQGKRTKEVAHAPAHPNCTCRVSAMKPSWRAGLQKLGYLDQDEEHPARL